MTKEIAEMAQLMRVDLDGRRLRVSLRWVNGGEYAVRQVDERNPKWYREFCAYYSPSRRRGWNWANARRRTYIKRRDTLRGLGELASGRCSSVYAERLAPFVENVLSKLPKTEYMIE